jgi:hypothetical protein
MCTIVRAVGPVETLAKRAAYVAPDLQQAYGQCSKGQMRNCPLAQWHTLQKTDEEQVSATRSTRVVMVLCQLKEGQNRSPKNSGVTGNRGCSESGSRRRMIELNPDVGWRNRLVSSGQQR